MTVSPSLPRKRGSRLFLNAAFLSALPLSACGQQDEPRPAAVERSTAQIEKDAGAAEDRGIDQARLRGEARASAEIKRIDENERKRLAEPK